MKALQICDFGIDITPQPHRNGVFSPLYERLIILARECDALVGCNDCIEVEDCERDWDAHIPEGRITEELYEKIRDYMCERLGRLLRNDTV